MMFYRLQQQPAVFRYLIIVICWFSQLWLFDFKEAMIVGGFFVLIWLYLHHYLSFLRSKLLAFIGRISYEWYLIHTNIGYVIMRKLYGFNLNPLVAILAPLIITFILAVGLYYGIELPIKSTLRQWWRFKNRPV